MDTSRTIKSKQYEPIEPFWTSADGYQMKFHSETRQDVNYTTTRDKRHPRRFYCTCPSKGLCKHITALVLSFANPRYEHSSVWTSEQDAGNQRRRDLTLTANGHEFYVTYGKRRLSLDNPDVLAVALVGPWVTPQVELIFNWKSDRVIVPGTDLLNEAARRGWTGDSRGRIRPGVAA